MEEQTWKMEQSKETISERCIDIFNDKIDVKQVFLMFQLAMFCRTDLRSKKHLEHLSRSEKGWSKVSDDSQN